MTWLEIVDKFTVTLKGSHVVTATNFYTNSKPEDIADCCGVQFDNHISWLGRWLPCNPTKKAAWTRKTNREAKLKKQDKRYRKGLGIPTLYVDSRDKIVDEHGRVVGQIATHSGTEVFYTTANYPHESFGSIGTCVDTPRYVPTDWRWESWVRDDQHQSKYHDTPEGARNRVLRELAVALKNKALWDKQPEAMLRKKGGVE